jgi:hypothetical protein
MSRAPKRRICACPWRVVFFDKSLTNWCPSISSRKYQARGAGRLISSQEDVRELKKARKEGSLAEAMLDRRRKLKRSAAFLLLVFCVTPILTFFAVIDIVNSIRY